jgi:hypothetical protein
MSGKKPKRSTKSLEADVAALAQQNESLKLQLNFWHEQSRALENQVQLHQRLHLETLEAVRRINHDPVEFGELVKRAKEAYDADQQQRAGIESLIGAVALASTNQAYVIGELLPHLKPMLAQLGFVPSKPPAQGVKSIGECVG